VKLSVDVLRSAYAYLAETEPFVEWNLPDAEDVEFCVTDKPRVQGECHTRVIGAGVSFSFQIDICRRFHTHSDSLLRTMAHEMVHVHQRRNCINLTKKAHGRDFHALANEVCAAHGFDPGQF
jgi:hypothetical protein